MDKKHTITIQECSNTLGNKIIICREDRNDGFTKTLHFTPLTQDYEICYGYKSENKRFITTIFLPRAVELYNEL